MKGRDETVTLSGRAENMLSQLLKHIAAIIMTALFSMPVFAQPSLAATTFPAKPVRLIVPFPPGGPTDALARILSEKLSELWKQPVLVDNKSGAGTIIGTDAAAKAPADGYTLAMVITAYVINPGLYPQLPYDTLKDLAGVTQVSTQPVVLVANPAVPANNIKELIALAKAKPGDLTFASPGTGTSTHLAGELLKTAAGIDIRHIAYKGSSPALTDILGGRVALMFDILQSVQPYIKSGKLKAIAITGEKRAAAAPDIPTVAETVPGFNVSSMAGIVVAAATPREVIHKISADVAKVLATPEMREKLASLGFDPVGSTPEQFDRYIRAEIPKWTRVVKESGAKVE
jgi:tripartite-type tricarboxylate transporter receptor subunit TctC